MARVNFTGLAGNISDLNANFSQTYDLREYISTPGYVAATPKLALAAGGGWSIPIPTSGVALTVNPITSNGGVLVTGGAAANSALLGGTAIAGNSAFLQLAGNGNALGTTDLLVGQDSVGQANLMQRANVLMNIGTNNIARFQITAAGDTLQISSGGLGYGTGSGGTVTQITSKTTTVVLNKSNGGITLTAASLAATTSVSFVLTNSLIAATDVVNVSIRSGATLASYLVQVDAVAAGSCTITLRNYTAGALAEAVVLNFAVIKAVVA